MSKLADLDYKDIFNSFNVTFEKSQEYRQMKQQLNVLQNGTKSMQILSTYI